jgi:hypothetical protein
MSNIHKLPRASKSIRPEKIFLFDQVVQKFGVLEAAITADLYYWIFKVEKPWKVVSDYAGWFGVNEKTVRININKLASNKFFKMSRTRMRSGSYGANQFTKSNSINSKALFNLYVSLFNNGFDSGDFGEFDPNEPDYKENPKFQLLFMDTIKEAADIKAAYLLDRISWALNARCQDSLYFSSKSHFARWSNMDRKTSERKLTYLEQKGLIEFEFINNQLVVYTYEESSHFTRFSEFMEEKEEARKSGIIEATG